MVTEVIHITANKNFIKHTGTSDSFMAAIHNS